MEITFGSTRWMRAPRSASGHRRVDGALLEHGVDETVIARILARHEAVAVGVLGDLLDRLAGVLGQDLVQPLARVDDLARVDVDVRRLALDAARPRLVDHDPRMRQRVALALRTGREKQRTHAGRLTDAHRADIGL